MGVLIGSNLTIGRTFSSGFSPWVLLIPMTMSVAIDRNIITLKIFLSIYIG